MGVSTLETGGLNSSNTTSMRTVGPVVGVRPDAGRGALRPDWPIKYPRASVTASEGYQRLTTMTMNRPTEPKCENTTGRVGPA